MKEKKWKILKYNEFKHWNGSWQIECVDLDMTFIEEDAIECVKNLNKDYAVEGREYKRYFSMELINDNS